MPEGTGGVGPWGRALAMARETPAARNRYVDFLRAASILVVVLGHWLMAAPRVTAEGATLGHMLDLAPWTRWLTWALQVMPTFFLVGGFANATSWVSARGKGRSYGEWLYSRTVRLIGPILPLLVVWTLLAVAARLGGVGLGMVRIGSQVALVPTWFLAVYLGVVLLVPWTWAAWRRWGLISFVVPLLASAAVDWWGLARGHAWIRWTNYAFVWVAVHQLGYAWKEGRLRGAKAGLGWAVGGLALAAALVGWGAYPISMVGVPGQEISNTLPPTLALLAFACFQVGLVLALEGPARRWLEDERMWAATVLVNASIMTLYLWHSTVLVLVIGALVKLGGPGLGLAPGTAAWWWARIPWVACLALLLWPFLALFGRFERSASGAAPPTWRLIAGSLALCGGIGLLSLLGIAADNALGLSPYVALPLAGAVLAGLHGRAAARQDGPG
ncbi:MAG: acyltransferase [Thermoanaerobaculia bacterium]